MADLSDVENALTDLIVRIVYPGGTSVPGLGGRTLKVYRGSPSPLGLNSDLAASISTVSVFSDPKTTKETTRYPRIWRDQGVSIAAIAMSVVGRNVIVSGSGGVAQVAGVEVAGVAYCIGVSAVDTPATVAVGLAALIPGSSVNGAVLTIASEGQIVARTCGCGVSVMETRRQEQTIVVSVWCPDPASRDTISSELDASLSLIDWLQLVDGTAARVTYKETSEVDTSENANLYRRDLYYCVEYPTIAIATSPAMLFGQCVVGVAVDVTAPDTPLVIRTRPLLGAIRFDAWYDPQDPIDQQCAAALAPAVWRDRCPSNSVETVSGLTWPLASQNDFDAEIEAAVIAGIDFWAFDSYSPGSGLSRALSLYLASTLRSRVGFCMLGQTSNWGDPASASGYSSSLTRDIALMGAAGYVKVAGNRPVYLVLDSTASQTAALPNDSTVQAIDFVRRQAALQVGLNPYIVWLSGAALTDYDNVSVAAAIGADAAGAYSCPRLNGQTQTYQELAATATADWSLRSAAPLPMVATAMTGWDQRPLIETPQPFYPIAGGTANGGYYQTGTPADIASHIASAWQFTASNPSACEAGITLVYAWNELAEGGWLMPTFSPNGPDMSRVQALGLTMLSTVAQPNGATTITV